MADRKHEPCAGCGKDVDTTYGRYHNTTELPDGKDYVFCNGRGGPQSNISEACITKALKKLRICPGCGVHGKAEPGFLCRTCEHDLKQGREMVKRAAGLGWYGIDTRAWVPKTGADGGSKVSSLSEDAFRLLAQAFTVGRTEHRVEARGHGYGHHATMLAPDSYEHTWLTELSGPGFECTPEQAEALRGALAAFRDLYLAERLQGRKEGLSLLMQLSKGELTLDEFDQKQGTLLSLRDVKREKNQETD